jgi:hypothetical protein
VLWSCFGFWLEIEPGFWFSVANETRHSPSDAAIRIFLGVREVASKISGRRGRSTTTRLKKKQLCKERQTQAKARKEKRRAERGLE